MIVVKTMVKMTTMMMMTKIYIIDFVTVTLMMMIRITEPIEVVFTVYLTTNFISRLSMIICMKTVLNRTVVDGDYMFQQPVRWSSSESKWVVSCQLIVLNSSYWPDRSIKLECYWSSVSSAVMFLAMKTQNVIGAFWSVYSQSLTVIYC